MTSNTRRTVSFNTYQQYHRDRIEIKKTILLGVPAQ